MAVVSTGGSFDLEVFLENCPYSADQKAALSAAFFGFSYRDIQAAYNVDKSWLSRKMAGES